MITKIKLIGRKIKHKRKELKLSLQCLADKVQKSKAHIYEIEESKSDPQISTVVNIAEALGVPSLYLIDDSVNIGTYPQPIKELKSWKEQRITQAEKIIIDIFKKN